jgi:alpha-mannosidase
MKPAEEGDGTILRLYEPHGARGVATLRFAIPVLNVTAVNLLEELADDPAVVPVDDHAVRFPVRPFQIVTLKIRA